MGDLTTWSKNDLLKELSLYFDLIHCEYPDFRLADLERFEEIEKELERRGINWAKESKIKFHEVK
jgi:hypothetical protein